MIPIVGVSLEEALLGFGGDDAELHDKEVTLTTSDVTGSQTAIFEYDPEDEDPQGTPPGPWDGYSLFTIDLSGIKDDIEDLQQRISDAETCRQQVIAALQRYDPDYDPAEGECPSDKVGEVVDEVGELEDELEQCHDCKDEVIAAIQVYDPDYDPDPDECPAPEIQVVYEKGQENVNLGSKFITANGTYLPAGDNLDGYNQVVVDVAGAACIARIASYLGLTGDYDCDDIIDAIKEIEGYPIPPDVDVDDFTELVGMTDDVLEEQPYNIEIIVYVGESRTDPGWSVFSVTIKLSDGTEDPLFSYSFSPGGNYYIECTKIDINDNGILTAYGTFMHYSGEVRPVSYSANRDYLQGWESTNHTYIIKKQR